MKEQSISPKQRRIVKARVKGKSLKQIGDVEYPNANDSSKQVLVSTQLNKEHVAQYYQQSKLAALQKYNLGWDRIIKPVSDALNAEKESGEPDYAIRLSASKQAREMMPKQSMIDNDDKALPLKIPEGVNEIELQRIMFRNGGTGAE